MALPGAGGRTSWSTSKLKKAILARRRRTQLPSQSKELDDVSENSTRASDFATSKVVIGDYCLFRTGFLPTKTLLHYRRPLRMVCCLPCQLIYNGIETVQPGWMEENLEKKSISLTQQVIQNNNTTCTWTLFNVTLNEVGGLYNDVKLAMAGSIDMPTEDESINRPISLEAFVASLAARKTDVAVQWLEKCVLRHEICRVPDSSFIPQRLVDVGNDTIEPHLVEKDIKYCPELSSSSSPYAALSYCWGPPGNTFKTTRENIHLNKRNIALSVLPKTIQDAVRVCRAVGIKYLWVDALCIIQDDIGEKDWYEQSGKMRQIYSNSHFTISADDSPACTWGFWELSPERWKRLTLRCARNNYDADAWVMPRDKKDLDHNDILSTRGWALQEHVLPSRILHFTQRGLVWECNQFCANEDGNIDFDMTKFVFRALRVIKLGKKEIVSPPQGFGRVTEDGESSAIHITDFLTIYTPRSVYYAWNSIMERYSKRHLTNPADKLTAISGLASLIVEYLSLPSDAYLAGLWQDDLVEGLLWYVRGDFKIPHRARYCYVAPTWSWASIDGSIEYFKERYQFRFKSQIEVLEAKCKTLPEDPTGRITAGHLVLKGELVPVSLDVVPCPIDYKSQYTGNNGSASRTHLSQITRVQSLLSNKKVAYEVLCDEYMRMPLSVQNQCDMSSLDLSEDQGVYCLKVGVTIDSVTDGERYWWLVLQKVGGPSEVYRRVGLGYFQVYAGYFHLFDEVDCRTIKLV